MDMDINRILPAYLQRWLPTRHGLNPKEQVRDMITALVLVFNIFFCIISIAFIELFLRGMLTMEMVYARAVIYPCAAFYLFAAISLYGYGQMALARVIIIANIFFSCSAGIMLTGGYTVSPISSLVLLPAMFSFLLLGARPGVICAALSSLVVVVACVMEFYGVYTPLQAMPSKVVWHSLALFVPLVAMAMVVFSLMFYEMLTQRLQKDLQRERNQFHWDATHDALTRLPNRPEFYTRLVHAMQLAERNRQSLGLVMFDLDGFKPVNDTLGHHAGDIVLQQVAQRLEGLMRNVDTVARLGGDEFAIILQGASPDMAVLEKVLQKILQAVSAPMTIDGKSVTVGASLGVAFYREGDSLDDFCRQADMAMYEAKKQKNTWHLYCN